MIGWRCALCAVTMLVTAVLALGQQRVIIDTDPGTDDALAIYLALNSPELKVEALTVVPGTVVAEQGRGHALKLLREAWLSPARRERFEAHQRGRAMRRADRGGSEASVDAEAVHCDVLARKKWDRGH